ncbi:MAG: hypothetical protein FWC89_07925 [Defluviitaleaceae bacterium]|nr:hypothetical protein [Defluviitaleaceae bacterium]
MKKFMMFLLLLVLSTVTVYAQYEYDEQDEYVTFTYQQALQMAQRDMLTIIDANAQIRGIQDQLEDLSEEIRLLERGAHSREALDNLNMERWELERRLNQANQAQAQMQQSANTAVNEFIAGLAFNGYGPNPALGYAFQAAIQGIMTTNDLNNSIAMMERQYDSILNEMSRLRDRERANEMIEDTQQNMIELERQINVISLQQQQARLARESALISAINTVNELDFSIYVATAGLALTQEDLNRANVRYQFGLISTNNLRAAENALTQAEMDMETLLRNRSIAMQNLNQMLGQPLSQLTKIESNRPIYEPPDDLNITRKITQSPSIRQEQINVDRAREARANNTEDDEDIRTALREAYERAVMGHNQAITAMEASILRSLNELENLSVQRDSLLIELENAEQTLENTLVNLSLSRATQYDVEQALQSIRRIQQRIEANLNAKRTQSFLLENPSLLP